MLVPPDVIDEAEGAAWLLSVELLFVCCASASSGTKSMKPPIEASKVINFMELV